MLVSCPSAPRESCWSQQSFPQYMIEVWSSHLDGQVMLKMKDLGWVSAFIMTLMWERRFVGTSADCCAVVFCRRDASDVRADGFAAGASRAAKATSQQLNARVHWFAEKLIDFFRESTIQIQEGIHLSRRVGDQFTQRVCVRVFRVRQCFVNCLQNTSVVRKRDWNMIFRQTPTT